MITLDIDSSPPQHWDYVVSCFEPITRVTGGIGSYTRMLLEQLSQASVDDIPLRVLFITGERQRNDEFSAFCPNATVLFIPEHVRYGNNPLNNLEDPYRHFGMGIMRQLVVMQRFGHTFGYLETPDYSAEGYYVLKARKFGLLKFARTGIRLHSPLFMLHDDNNALAWCDNSAFRFHDMERYCIAEADDVLFGGDAMRDRVLSFLSADAARDAAKRSVKVPHPWPTTLHKVSKKLLRRGPPRFAYVGRLEYRKGVDLLVEAALEALKTIDFELHFFGRDTHTWRQGSMRGHLDRLIQGHPRAHRFVFHDYVPQNELWSKHLPKMDGFVFPSRFENYPNVLLEVLQFERPTIVSQFGCMPEMAAEFPSVRAIDPFRRAEFAKKLVEVIGKPAPTKPKQPIYPRVMQEQNSGLVRGYASLLKPRAARTDAPFAATKKNVSITFVVAHYNQSAHLGHLLHCLKQESIAGDEVIVIDDNSKSAESAAASRLVKNAGYTFLRTPENSGPSAARNLGIKAAKTEAIYVVDADDVLEPGSTAILRNALGTYPELDVVSGFFQAFQDEQHLWAAYDPILETVLLENSSHCGILARRQVFDRIGLYAERQRDHFEDWELTMRMAIANVRFEILPLVSYRYRVQKRTSRNNTRLEKAGYSYEQALANALNASLSHADDARLARLLPSLLVRRNSLSAPADTGPKPIRYEVADRMNLFVKRTPVHSSLKKIAKQAFRLPG